MRSAFIILLLLFAGYSSAQTLGDLQFVNATVVKKESLVENILGHRVKVSRWTNVAKTRVQLSCNIGDPSKNIWDTVQNTVHVSHAYDTDSMLYKTMLTEIKNYADTKTAWGKLYSGGSRDFSYFPYNKSFFVNGDVVVPFIWSGAKRDGDCQIFYFNSQVYKIARADCIGFGCLSLFVGQNMYFVKDGARLPLGRYIRHIDTVNQLVAEGLRKYTYPDLIHKDYINKAEISKRDSSFTVTADIRKDHRIIGYEKPDVNSKRLIIFSVFTRDVQGNPYQCPYGAYYSSSRDLKMKFRGWDGNFVVVQLIKPDEVIDLYFQWEWVRFID